MPLSSLPGPLARIKAVAYGQIDSPLKATAHSPSRSVGAVPVSSGIMVTLEKLVDRNGIAMLSAADDAAHLGFPRSSRSAHVEVRVPLRLLGSRVRVLSAAEAERAMAEVAEKVFVVRYAGGEHGGPVEPVQVPARFYLRDYTSEITPPR